MTRFPSLLIAPQTIIDGLYFLVGVMYFELNLFTSFDRRTYSRHRGMSSIFYSTRSLHNFLRLAFCLIVRAGLLQATLPINLLSLSRRFTVSIETCVSILHAVLSCQAVNLGFRFEVIISFETLRFESLHGRPIFGRFLIP